MQELERPDAGELLVLDPAMKYDTGRPTEDRRTALWALVGAACLVAGLIAAVAVVVLRANSADSDAAATARSRTATEQGLWDLAARVAAQDGTTLKSADAVYTSEARALEAIGGGSGSPAIPDEVWFVQATGSGDFDCKCGRPIQGSYLVLVVDPATMESLAGGVSPRPVDLSALGTVVDLGGH